MSDSKRYKVVGTQPVLDHMPGEEFTTYIPVDLEAFLFEIGAIKEVPLLKEQKDE